MTESKRGPQPGPLDVLTMSSEIVRLYGGKVTFGLSAPTANNTAVLLTAYWNVPIPGGPTVPPVMAQDIAVSCVMPTNDSHNPYAYQYRLLWSLSTAIGEALGSDASF